MRSRKAKRCLRSGFNFIFALTLATTAHPANAQPLEPYHRSLSVSLAEPVQLDVEVSKGEVRIFYSHEGEVSITTSGGASPGNPSTGGLAAAPSIEQNGNGIRIRDTPDAGYDATSAVLYRIDVPYRTVVRATVQEGKLSISGVLGPVQATTRIGNIALSYVSKETTAQTGSGNIALQVIGGKVTASAEKGNISCTRATQDVVAETNDGDIDFAVVGAASAIVKTGTGRVTIQGARAKLSVTTDAGELHVKAVPRDSWHLQSKAGVVRVEFPPDVKAELDAASQSGTISVERNDVQHPENAHRRHQSLNGGGPTVKVQTESGAIVIQ